MGYKFWEWRHVAWFPILILGIVNFASAGYGATASVMPPGEIELVPVGTSPAGITAVAQSVVWNPRFYPTWVRVIAPQDGGYGLFKLSEPSKPVFGPAELEPNSLAVSWDGFHIVLSVKRGDYYKLALLIEHYSEVELFPLTQGPGNDHSPALSPDKSFVAFISDRDGRPKLYGLEIEHPEIIGLPGGPRPVQLFPGPGEERRPAFGEYGLAFLSDLMGTWDLWVLEGPDRDSPRRVLTNVDPESPLVWVGDWIFVVRDGVPGLVSRDGRFFRPLSGGPKGWWKGPGAPNFVLRDGVIHRVEFPPPLSPDLAFFRLRGGEGVGELWLATLDGSRWKVADRVPAGEAAWSPDGTRLAYLRRGERVPPLLGPEAGYQPDWYELWVADADGTDARCIRTFSPYGGEYAVHSLAWGPKGDRLLFALAQGGTPVYELHSIRPDGSGKEGLFGGVWTCVVHPTGIVTGVARGPVLYSYNLATDEWTSHWEFGQLWEAAFSPSGRYAIAFKEGELVLLDCVERTERLLLPGVLGSADTQPYSPPAWSPDERRFAYVSDWDGDGEIWIYDLEEDRAVRITDNDYDDYQPSWSPDGRYLAYVSEEDVFPAIRVFSLDDGETLAITRGEGEDVLPIWRPKGGG